MGPQGATKQVTKGGGGKKGLGSWGHSFILLNYCFLGGHGEKKERIQGSGEKSQWKYLKG